MGGEYRDLAKKRAAQVRASAKYRDADPERHRAIQRKSQYGMTKEHYDRLLLEQEGRCAICGVEFVTGPLDRKKSLVPHVDHNHETGQLRSLLCDACNRKVGHIERTDVGRFLRYLTRWEYRTIHR